MPLTTMFPIPSSQETATKSLQNKLAEFIRMKMLSCGWCWWWGWCCMMVYMWVVGGLQMQYLIYRWAKHEGSHLFVNHSFNIFHVDKQQLTSFNFNFNFPCASGSFTSQKIRGYFAVVFFSPTMRIFERWLNIVNYIEGTDDSVLFIAF